MRDAGAVTSAPDLDRVAAADTDPGGPSPSAAEPPATAPTADRRLETALALVAVGLVGLRVDLKSGITSGLVVALALVPVWVPALKRFAGARLFVCIALVAALSGLLLVELAAPPPAITANVRTNTLAVLTGVIGGVGLVLWARTLASQRAIGLAFGAGMLVSGALGGGGSANPWKFTWAVPTAIVLLSLAQRRAPGRDGGGPGAPHKAREVLVLAVLALASAYFDSRSYLATFVLAALLVVVPVRRGALSRRASWIWVTATFAAVAAAVYYLATTLLVDGYLGQEAQLRSIQQISDSGSLLLGGRPELAATIALMRDHPTGFGAGYVPTPDIVQTAKTGLAAINYNPDNGYVDNYMFGGHVELHSTFGDLWANYGLAGVGLAVLVGAVILRGLSEGIARRTISATLVFLCCWSLWNLLFSPFYSAAPTLTLGIGLLLAARHGDERPDDDRPDASALRVALPGDHRTVPGATLVARD